MPVCLTYVLLCMHVCTHFPLEQDHEISQDASVELITRCSLLSSHVTSCDQWCQVIKEYQQRVKAHYDYLAR